MQKDRPAGLPKFLKIPDILFAVFVDHDFNPFREPPDVSIFTPGIRFAIAVVTDVYPLCNRACDAADNALTNGATECLRRRNNRVIRFIKPVFEPYQGAIYARSKPRKQVTEDFAKRTNRIIAKGFPVNAVFRKVRF